MIELGQFVPDREFKRLAPLHWAAKYLYRCLRAMAASSVHPGYVGIDQQVTWAWLVETLFTTDNKRGFSSLEVDHEMLRRTVCPKLMHAGLLKLFSMSGRLIFYVPAVGKGEYAPNKVVGFVVGYAPPLDKANQGLVSFAKLGNWKLPIDEVAGLVTGKVVGIPEGHHIYKKGSATNTRKTLHAVDNSAIREAAVEKLDIVKALGDLHAAVGKNSRGSAKSDRASPSKDSIALSDRMMTKRLH